MTIHRQSLYFPRDDAQLFGWYHHCDTAVSCNLVAVVCPPLGYEYTHSHRSLRHLCDRLAEAGIPAFRFDFHGTGDSAGGELEPDRLARWQQDLAAAVEQAKALASCEQVCVIGVRLGATLAAMASAIITPDWLVLWNPITSGRRYLRELKATASTTQDNAGAADTNNPDILESGGFLITTETGQELSAINLLEITITAQKATLIVTRDDMSANTDLQDALNQRGVRTDQTALPGYTDMMARLEINKVPDQAIAGIVEWIKNQSSLNPANTKFQTAASELPTRMVLASPAGELTETLCQFGQNHHLFGIFSFAGREALDRPTIILLNSGSVHHVGPGRLYVTLARHLAQQGFNCFRVDIEGIGDSVRQQGDRKENHPYPDSAFDDTAAALDYLRQHWSCTRFALVGLCSGGYTAFHAGIQQHTDTSIKHVVSINPLTFRWIEGETLLLSQSMKEELWVVNHYSSSARDWRRWVKLLTGKVDYADIFRLVRGQITNKIRTALHLLHERMSPGPTTLLGQQLVALLNAKRSLSFLISTGDPGYHLLLKEGGYYARKLIQSRKIAIYHIDKTDHTFSRLQPRTQAIELLTQDLNRAFEKQQ